MTSSHRISRVPFLSGVFLIAFSMLIFQIVQTRILSVVTWYYMAFFAISVAMLGMTIGAVWVYRWRERFQQTPLPIVLSKFALATAVAMPASVMVQFCLVTAFSVSLTLVVAWSFLLIAMTLPYVFSGVVVSLALTRSPFPIGLVYGADLLGASLGCAAVVVLLSFLDGPTSAILSGVISALSSVVFFASASPEDRQLFRSKSWWQRPVPIAAALAAFVLLNSLTPVGIRPILVKDTLETSSLGLYERWNSYSRVIASRVGTSVPFLWGPSPEMPADTRVPQAYLNIDGTAGTAMFRYDGTRDSLSFLRYDLVNLAYRLPGIRKSAVIGVGGGRDLMSAYSMGVSDITGVELNPIFIDLLTRDPLYSKFSNLTALPNVKLHVDDARSWFSGTKEKFDLIQMSMIDTWAATGAGAFSLSENGLYTLEGWRTFLRAINDHGIFTVSRWYTPGDMNETGRMIGLATAVLLDLGITDARQHLFVARTENIATLVLSKSPFTEEQLHVLKSTVQDLGFDVLLAPGQPPESSLLGEIIRSHDARSLNQALDSTRLDLTVPTDNRPFFFFQLRFSDVPKLVFDKTLGAGVTRGNLIASAVLILILFISIIAVVETILVPLRETAHKSSLPLIVVGSLYFSLIGFGFMLTEIALLQRFSVYLGHPVYSLSVCLFSLILATGMGSLTSERLKLDGRVKLLLWGGAVVVYLVLLERLLPVVLESTMDRDRLARAAISLIAIMPLGFLLGFAFPTGMRLVEAQDRRPTPWFWGVNGATGVLASVLGLMLSMSFGISATMFIAAACYLLLIPTSLVLFGLGKNAEQRDLTAALRPAAIVGDQEI
jgi:hypothetical protein